jgi:hypothetical protein
LGKGVQDIQLRKDVDHLHPVGLETGEMLDYGFEERTYGLVHLLLLLLDLGCELLRHQSCEAIGFNRGRRKVELFHFFFDGSFWHLNLISVPGRDVFEFLTVQLLFPHFELLIKFFIEKVNFIFSIIKILISAWHGLNCISPFVIHNRSKDFFTVSSDVRH